MLIITNHWRNVNQNYNEVPPHTSQNDHLQKNLQIINAGESMEKEELSYTVGGNITWYSLYGEPYRAGSSSKN